jgi:hypothetical protein
MNYFFRRNSRLDTGLLSSYQSLLINSHTQSHHDPHQTGVDPAVAKCKLRGKRDRNFWAVVVVPGFFG